MADSLETSMPSSARLPPGPPRWATPRLLCHLQRDRLDFFESLWKAHGDLVRIPIAHRTLYLVNDPTEIERILRSNHKNYTKDDEFNRHRKATLGVSLLTAEGQDWRRHRRIVQPPLRRRAVDAYVEEMARVTAEEMDAWDPSPTRPVDLADAMAAIAIRISSTLLLGIDLQEHVRTIRRCTEVVVRTVSARMANPLPLPLGIPLPSHVAYHRAVTDLESLIYRILEERRADPSSGTDVLSRLVSAGRDDPEQALSLTRLRNEAMTFLLAGYESTSAALAWMMVLLGRHPHVLDRLYSEVTEVLGDRLPTAADMEALEYTTWIVQEAMRLYPPSWLFDRRAVAADTLGNFSVPAGASLLIAPYLLHRHPDHWEDPERFDPTRFSPERSEGRHPFAYVPFSDGPRKCIGARFALLESTVVLAMFAQRHRPVLVQTHPILPQTSVALRPHAGVQAIIVPSGAPSRP